MWDDSKHNVLNMIEGTFSISLNIIEDDGFSWWFTSVAITVSFCVLKKRIIVVSFIFGMVM